MTKRFNTISEFNKKKKDFLVDRDILLSEEEFGHYVCLLMPVQLGVWPLTTYIRTGEAPLDFYNAVIRIDCKDETL